MSVYKNVEIKELVGKAIKKIDGLENESEKVIIITECGKEYIFHHVQDCCEQVYLIDHDGDADDFVGSLVLSAECIESFDNVQKPEDDFDSYTWTFYKIETSKGGLWMRWYGGSNGYYSEKVDFAFVDGVICK